MEQRGQLAELVAAARRNGTAGAAPPLAPLTQTMPLLVGNLSRADLLWLCHDVRASACVDYIERDEQASIFSCHPALATVSSGHACLGS